MKRANQISNIESFEKFPQKVNNLLELTISVGLALEKNCFNLLSFKCW